MPNDINNKGGFDKQKIASGGQSGGLGRLTWQNLFTNEHLKEIEAMGAQAVNDAKRVGEPPTAQGLLKDVNLGHIVPPIRPEHLSNFKSPTASGVLGTLRNYDLDPYTLISNTNTASEVLRTLQNRENDPDLSTLISNTNEGPLKKVLPDTHRLLREIDTEREVDGASKLKVLDHTTPPSFNIDMATEKIAENFKNATALINAVEGIVATSRKNLDNRSPFRGLTKQWQEDFPGTPREKAQELAKGTLKLQETQARYKAVQKVMDILRSSTEESNTKSYNLEETRKFLHSYARVAGDTIADVIINAENANKDIEYNIQQKVKDPDRHYLAEYPSLLAKQWSEEWKKGK